jgi:hypothetical protein
LHPHQVAQAGRHIAVHAGNAAEGRASEKQEQD